MATCKSKEGMNWDRIYVQANKHNIMENKINVAGAQVEVGIQPFSALFAFLKLK